MFGYPAALAVMRHQARKFALGLVRQMLKGGDVSHMPGRIIVAFPRRLFLLFTHLCSRPLGMPRIMTLSQGEGCTVGGQAWLAENLFVAIGNLRKRRIGAHRLHEILERQTQ
jgi:hypothetical protein